jgi:hypothetical protein
METEQRKAKLLAQLEQLARQEHCKRVEHCLQRWIENTPKEN